MTTAPFKLPKSLRSLRGQHLATIAQLSARQVMDIVRYAYILKCRSRWRPALRGRTVALLFEKPSTRTRLSIHTAATEEGGGVIDINKGATHLDTKESRADTIRTVSQFCSAIAYRGVSHAAFERLCAQATVPVINALTARYHPTQALADLLTIYAHFGTLTGITIAYIGDGNNNVARSLALATAKIGVALVLSSPARYRLDDETIARCQQCATDGAPSPRQEDDPARAVANADVVYTDVWYSMGDEAEKEKRIAAFQDYRVTDALIRSAKEKAIFMHCLPANRGDEVTDEIIDGPQSVVWRQAGNRRHIFKALFRALL